MLVESCRPNFLSSGLFVIFAIEGGFIILLGGREMAPTFSDAAFELFDSCVAAPFVLCVDCVFIIFLFLSLLCGLLKVRVSRSRFRVSEWVDGRQPNNNRTFHKELSCMKN